MEKRITAPLTPEIAKNLRCGDRVLLSGIIFTARDAAHKRMIEALGRNEKLPFDIRGSVIYYVGPTPAAPGQVIGSAGPTTSGRMDAYAPRLLDLGLAGMIGKGARKQPVIDAMKRNGAVYLGAVGGAGALLGRCVKESEPIAYDDLGAEAVRRLTVEDMPLTVIIDSDGNNLYESGPSAWLDNRAGTVGR